MLWLPSPRILNSNLEIKECQCVMMCPCIYMRSVVIIFHFKSTHYISFVLIDSKLYFVWAEQKVNKKQLINISSRFTFKEDVYVVISVCTNIDHRIG